MNHHENDRIGHAVRSLEQVLHARPERGEIDSDTALAMDIVTHALEFTHTEDGLSLWREALWGRKLLEQARIAVFRLLEHITSAAERGDSDAINDICGCLHRVVGQDLFGGSAPRIGGIRTSSLERQQAHQTLHFVQSTKVTTRRRSTGTQEE